MPSAAMAATRHQRETSLAASATGFGEQAEAVERHQGGEAEQEQRQRRLGAGRAAAGARAATKAMANTTGSSMVTRSSFT